MEEKLNKVLAFAEEDMILEAWEQEREEENV